MKSNRRQQWLNLEERIFVGLMKAATYGIAAVLLLIILTILVKGLPALSWEMVSQTPKGGFYFGKEGGILNAIVGSLYLAVGSTSLAFLIGLPVALFMNVHLLNKKKLVNGIRFMLDLLWGVPSIVYGAFGFTLMVYMGMRTSLLAGIITVTLFIIPIMVRSIDEVLKTVPRGLLEASLSLGSTRSETAFRVFVRQCYPGIITAILLSFGRAIGDAAAVLFTTGYTDYLPQSINDPTATLPLAIFFQLSSPIPEVKARAYASALVLTIIILIISLLSRHLSRKFEKNKIKF
ncbi:phosphate ABC transporter permease PstA [Williamwhitmania taraxaci]|uniref:Phosphate transport system permease protein PstA n=1 Tax=Williamwhitmania taraxaci TaxID=1640674 RepID=A0A1G6QY92_9BACT|nr:phosphate ABC transporter permease PstA [Williamwhitmania taraxaci]SDC97370.1 phosphate transport system permease protein [Williamwhitmania taraxaci]